MSDLNERKRNTPIISEARTNKNKVFPKLNFLNPYNPQNKATKRIIRVLLADIQNSKRKNGKEVE